MILRGVLVIIFGLASLTANADPLDDKLKLCGQHFENAHCVGLVLLEAIRQYASSGSTTTKPRCRCMAGGHGENVTSLYYIDGEDSMVLANGLRPQECLQAFNFFPCRQ